MTRSDSIHTIPENKKVYFASDLHLGLPGRSRKQEIEREKFIVQWLSEIEKDAHMLFLLGDIFDFWYEYKYSAPQGFVRFLSKIARLTEKGIPVYFFTGNHDVWIGNYLKTEVDVEVHTDPLVLVLNNKKFLLAHGDGLGPGDNFYKLIKKVFRFKPAQWLFRWLHPDIGIGFAKKWSSSSRLANAKKDEQFLGEKEFLIRYCREIEKSDHHDYYVFGHRHLPLDIEIGANSRYYNLGEWVNQCTYGTFDGTTFSLQSYKK